MQPHTAQMMNILIDIMRATAVVLFLLPVVHLVDQHGHGKAERIGNRKPAVVSRDSGGGLDNQTRITAQEGRLGATRAISGKWNSLSPTLVSDMVAAASSSMSTAHFHQPFPSAFAIFPSIMSSSTPTEAKRFHSSPTSSSSSSNHGFGRRTALTTQQHHHHKNHLAQANADILLHPKGSFQLLSAVESPVPMASTTRVTGPYFESNKTIIHISAKAGQSVILDCAVILLQGRTVSWLRRGKDSLQLLTVGNTTYYSDPRLGLRFRYPNNWRLGIESVNKGDEAEYQCQLSTHPPRTLLYQLRVIAPTVEILDENGHTVLERHYRVDSSLHLTCRANHIDKHVDKVVWYKGDKALPGGDSRVKVKVSKNADNGEATVYLTVLSVRKSDSSNYSCRASSLASSTVSVHVLNGELPAAVQHESCAHKLLFPKSALAVLISMSAYVTLDISLYSSFASSVIQIASAFLLTFLFVLFY